MNVILLSLREPIYKWFDIFVARIFGSFWIFVYWWTSRQRQGRDGEETFRRRHTKQKMVQLTRRLPSKRDLFSLPDKVSKISLIILVIYIACHNYYSSMRLGCIYIGIYLNFINSFRWKNMWCIIQDTSILGLDPKTGEIHVVLLFDKSKLPALNFCNS